MGNGHEKIRILLAGAGGYGGNYLRKLLEEPADWDFAGVADPFAAGSPHYAELERRNIPVYKSPAEFFQTQRADLTIISSPIHTHAEYTMLALDKGSNVLCEKPFCADLALFDRALRKEEETGLFVAVGFQLCYSPAVLACKQDIIDGLYGKPLCLKTICLPRRGAAYYGRNKWAGRLSFEGISVLDSPLNNACAHELQLMVFLLGKDLRSSADIVSLKAQLWRARKEIENFDVAALRAITGEDAELLFYTAHCVEPAQTGPWGEYRFERGTIRWGEASKNLVAEFSDGGVKDYGPVYAVGGNLQKFHDALAAVQQGGKPVCGLAASRTQVKSVVLAGEFPITPIGPEKIVRGESETGDPFFYVPGLDEALVRCYHENRLPEDLGYSF